MEIDADVEYNRHLVENIARCRLYSVSVLRMRENYDTLSRI